MCQNVALQVYGAWIKTNYVLCSKHIAPLSMCYKPPLVRDKPLGAPASVKRVYLNMFIQENISKNVV